MVADLIGRWFPALSPDNHRVTSPQSDDYNCAAFAAGDTTRWWWPLLPYYWPESAPRDESLEAFVHAYASLGFQPCEREELEAGYEKIAMFATSAGEPTHVARQLSSGWWTSKLGPREDIQHSLRALCGPAYGSVVQILRRRRDGAAHSADQHS